MGDTNATEHELSSRVSSLKARVANLRTEQGPDSVLWRWSRDERFSMKSTYFVLSNGGTRDVRASKDLETPYTFKIESVLLAHS